MERLTIEYRSSHGRSLANCTHIIKQSNPTGQAIAVGVADVTAVRYRP